MISSPWSANSVWAVYPEKSIRFIAPYSPGGNCDLNARILAHYANPFLDNKIYVENIVGATGAIGFRTAAKAPPDGNTLASMVTVSTVGSHIKGYPSYELFDPIFVVAQDPWFSR
jgi:tripartite-type tricarboxylate transporter receptor subunit TctC